MARHSAYLVLAALAAAQPAHSDPIRAGAVTHGGAVTGAQVLHVTTLADSGPGSFREAKHVNGPRVIVFDIAGVIHLASDLKISIPDVTIAGQTAPPPGITLTGGTLLLRADNLVLQHIAVRPGPGSTPKINGNRDSITIGGGSHEVHDVRVENVSLSWSVDENADVGGGTRNVTIRNSIIAEALNNAGHPKGHHSMGMLINRDNQGVAITGNLFVSNMFRNPVIARGSSALVAYNHIVNPGRNAVHFYDVGAPTPLRATVIGNVVQAGSDTSARVTAVQIPDDMEEAVPDAQIYLKNNDAPAGALTNRGNFPLAAAPPVIAIEPVAAPDDVRAYALRYAGSRPGQRDAQDKRILYDVINGISRIIDNPSDVGGLSDTPEVKALAEAPTQPFAPSRIAGLLRIEAWLCERHLEVGGPSTPECALPLDAYKTSLRAQFSERR
ncbi:MAG TPA: hypothetical protein VLT91_09085 [Rhizomicrobium sp.]|nr:hypothetical protein [Rhizomicrobium sp.]